MKLWIVALVAALSLGCTSNVSPPTTSPSVVHSPVFHGDLFIDSAFFPDELEAINQGAADWTAATKGAVTFTTHIRGAQEVLEYVGSECRRNITILRAPVDLDLIQDIEKAKPNDGVHVSIAYTVNRCSGSLMLLIMGRMSSLSILRPVVAHELGHFLGLEHSKPAERSIMTAYLEDSALCITPRDLNYLCATHGCDAGPMAPCPQ